METLSARQKWGTLIGCSISCFIGMIDFAIVNTALPAIQEGLSASIVELQWVINAFVLMVAVFPATTGRAADMYGRRFINLLGVVIFGIASLIAGIAPNIAFLIFARILQGIGIAAIIPSSLALITHAFPPEQKGKAIGIWSGITGIGLALGPVVGGILVSALNWRWIFYINVPFVIASLIIIILFVKESKNTTTEKKMDPLGFSLLTVGVFTLITGLMHTLDWGWTSPYTMICFGIAVVSLIWFYFSENKCPYPIIPFSAFSNRTFLTCAIILFCVFFLITSMFFIIPLYLQLVREEPAYIAGLMLLPITAIVAIFSPVVGHLVDRVSSKMLILLGLSFFFISTLLQVFFHQNTSPILVLIALFFMGFGWAFARNPATTLGITALPPHLSGAATGMIWTIQNVGSTTGLALSGSLFRHFYEPAKTHASFLQGYRWAMLLLVGVALVCFLFSLIRKQHPLPKK